MTPKLEKIIRETLIRQYRDGFICNVCDSWLDKEDDSICHMCWKHPSVISAIEKASEEGKKGETKCKKEY